MAGTVIAGQTGVQALGDGVPTPPRLIRTGELGVSEIHGRFYEQTYRGNVYMGGMTALTSISAATFTSATVTSTATPIVGLFNPITSTVNLSVLQAQLAVIITALTATGTAPYVWMASTGNPAPLTTGSNPTNCKTLVAAGSQAKVFGGTALTGLNTGLALLRGSSLTGGPPINTSQTYTVAGIPQLVTSVENIDGSIIVPPGGVLALMGTTTGVALSAISGILWEEVPL